MRAKLKVHLASAAVLPFVVLTALICMALPIFFMIGIANVCDFLGHLFH